MILQAWIDNELGEADRMILQEHVAECASCAAALRSQQRASAQMFESFSDQRRTQNFRTFVLEHLPEMDPLRSRLKNETRLETQTARRNWFAALVPVTFAAMLAVLVMVLHQNWPHPLSASGMNEAVGVVTQRLGLAHHTMNKNTAVEGAEKKQFIVCGQYYRTGPGGKLLLTLRGPTHLKVNENSTLKINDDREIDIESGQVWFDVCKSDRQFTVKTPMGKVAVKGTTFEVKVEPHCATVSVKTGVVDVNNGLASAELKASEQVELIAGRAVLEPRPFDPADALKWADAITPDKDAYNFFAQSIQMRPVAEMPAEQVFVVVAGDAQRTKAVSAFFVAWEPDAVGSERCSYDVYIYNDSMTELFKQHIDGAVFSDKDKRSFEIAVPGEPISKVNVIHIKLVPDFSTGTVKTSFSRVSALGI